MGATNGGLSSGRPTLAVPSPLVLGQTLHDVEVEHELNGFGLVDPNVVPVEIERVCVDLDDPVIPK